MNKYVVSSSMGGLSNRLKCLSSSMRLSEKTKRELLLYWPKDSSCNSHFSELFENNIKELSREDMKKIIKRKECEIYKEDLKEFRGQKQFIINLSTKIIGFTSKDIQLKFEEIPRDILIDILSYLNKLKIKKDILNIAELFSKKEFTKDTVGIHIRRGDFKDISNLGEISSDLRFIEEIKKKLESNPERRFFLATEEKETEEKFKKIFGNKIISYPKRTNKREEEGAVREALIELLLLSRCGETLGSFGSTFTEMAWFIGDCKPKVKIIVNKAALKRHLELEKIKDGKFSKIKKFIYNIITPQHIQILGKSN